jgi:hypothetical protein
MRHERVLLMTREYRAIQQLRHECFATRDSAAWEPGLRTILGDWMVDRMKKLAAEEPTVFVLLSTLLEPAQCEITVEGDSPCD